MTNKYIFGTAQFSGKYGVTNKTGNLSQIEIIKILKYLNKKKIHSLDTSTEYKLVDKKIKLGKYKKWKIITKINPERFKNCKNRSEIDDKIIKILNLHKKNLGVKEISCLLLHNEKYLMSKKANLLYSSIKYLKKKKYFKKFGYSIYSFKKLKKNSFKIKTRYYSVPI